MKNAFFNRNHWYMTKESERDKNQVCIQLSENYMKAVSGLISATMARSSNYTVKLIRF